MNVGYAIKILQKLRAIRRRDTHLDKRALARAFIKTQLKYLFGVRLLRLRPMSERVMGLTVRFFDYATFAFLFEEIFVNEQYRFECRSETPVIVDCGANIGLAALYFKTAYPGARVIAFEPDERTCEMLRHNVEANGLTGVEVVSAALADHDGTIDLYYDPETPGSVLMTTKEGVLGKKRPVRAVRLSESIAGETEFVKLDVEGAEAVVLGELAAAGKLARVRQMAVEYSHHHPAPESDELAHVLGLLESNGFGYTLSAPYPAPLRARAPQNILIHAYRKE